MTKQYVDIEEVIKALEQHRFYHSVTVVKKLPTIKLPEEKPLTMEEVKSWVDKQPMDCEDRPNCIGCPRKYICDYLGDAGDWDVNEMTKRVRGEQ